MLLLKTDTNIIII